jgi:hypothetical protein
MDNATRKQLLQRHKMSGFPGSIIDVYQAYGQGVDLIGQYEQQQMAQQQQPAQPQTPQQPQAIQQPEAQAPQIKANIQSPQVGGNLVKSYDNQSLGLSNLGIESQEGMNFKMKTGGMKMNRYFRFGGVDRHYKRYEDGGPKNEPPENEPQEFKQEAPTDPIIQGPVTGLDPASALNVKLIQQNLVDKGYDIGEYGVDGNWGDATELAFRQYLEDEGGGRDSWYNPSRWGTYPRAVTQSLSDAFYNQLGVDQTNDYITNWSNREVDAIYDASDRALQSGRGAFVYGDYATSEGSLDDVGGPNANIFTSVSRALNPSYNMKTVLGRAQIGIAPPYGDRGARRVIMDQYNFNDAANASVTDGEAWEAVKDRAKTTNDPVYGAFRGIGQQFGSEEGEGERTFLVLPERERMGGIRRNGGLRNQRKYFK